MASRRQRSRRAGLPSKGIEGKAKASANGDALGQRPGKGGPWALISSRLKKKLAAEPFPLLEDEDQHRQSFALLVRALAREECPEAEAQGGSGSLGCLACLGTGCCSHVVVLPVLAGSAGPSGFFGRQKGRLARPPARKAGSPACRLGAGAVELGTSAGSSSAAV